MKGWKLHIFLLVAGIGAAVIVGRLFYLQVISHKFYESLALGQQAGFAEVQGNRGQIFFQNSKGTDGKQGSSDAKSLAINKDSWLVSAVPGKITDPEATAQALAAIIDLPKDSISAKLRTASTYSIIKKNITDTEVKGIKEAKLTGVSLENSPARYYPQGALAAQVIGFFGGNKVGQYGLEGYYEDILKGKAGIREDKKGLNIIDSTTQADLDGSDLYLTIDYNIQFQAELLLKQEKAKNNIDSGQIIVLKPDSGRVLAIANYPSFDLNQYSKEEDLDIFQNSAIQKLFEPGSVFKPFTMAMALQEGRVTPESTFEDTGSVTIGPDTINNFNHEKYGRRDMSGILEKSINTGAVFLEESVSHQTFIGYLEKMGFNYQTGIDLQGEVFSNNDILKKGSDFGFATASFGQGIEMTPIQLVRAFSIFANGGKMPKPYVVEKIVHGGEEEKTKPTLSGNVISQKTAADVTKMLINVVERGFGDKARVPGYYIAGKTGTAEVPIENKVGYYKDKTIQSFIGYGPALAPQFVILVKLDNPKVPKSSLSAAPVFKKMAQYIINYWQIPPDYDVTDTADTK